MSSTWGRITKETLTAIASAIRAKTGKTAAIAPVDMPAEIASIPQKELPPAPVDARGRSEWDRWTWQRPAMMWLDPQAAVQAEMQEIRIGVKTLNQAAAERGLDLEETLRERAREISLCRSIEAENGLQPGSLSDIQIPGQTPAPAPAPETEAAK